MDHGSDIHVNISLTLTDYLKKIVVVFNLQAFPTVVSRFNTWDIFEVKMGGCQRLK